MALDKTPAIRRVKPRSVSLSPAVDENAEANQPLVEVGILSGESNAPAAQRESLGPWAGADFELTASRFAGPGSDVESPPETRFVRGVSTVIRRRMARVAGEEQEASPAVFLLHPNLPEGSLIVSQKREPIIDDGECAVTGRLWFVNEVVVSGYYIEHKKTARNDVFSYVVGEEKLGNVPAVFFDPNSRTSKLRFYPQGLGDVDRYEAIKFDSPVTLEAVIAEVQGAYDCSLVNPMVHTPALKLWTNGHAISDAEGRVQSVLVERFRKAFPTCTIRFEQASKAGRDDIEIEEQDVLERNKVTRHVVLELKVLRETDSPSFIKKHISGGVRQAAAYRDDKDFANGLLCCFDMRKQNVGVTCFSHVVKSAKKLALMLKVWYLYSTVQTWREANYDADE